MPLTPFHLGFAWPVWILKRKRLHFMSLSFGAMVPDIEVIPIMLVTSEGERTRGLMHSLLGAVTFDILVVMFIAFFIFPPLGRWIRRRSEEKWHIFAGVDVTKAPANIGWALLSALTGTLSHVIIDMFTHDYNPLFWPYYTQRDMNWMPFPDTFTSSLVLTVPLGIAALAMALMYWTKPFRVSK